MTLTAAALAFSAPVSLPRSASSQRSISRKPRHHYQPPPRAVAQHPPTTKTTTPAAPRTTTPPWILSYLLQNKSIVDKQLDTCLQKEDHHTAKIIDSMKYSLLAGGKRIRPTLAIAAYQMFASNPDDLDPVMPTALSVEMIHTMSLIHDDLPSMDNDDFRRGKPTNHMIYGEDIAILAGDAMLSYAFEYVARNTKGVDPQRVIDVLALLTNSVGPEGLAGGQVMDLESEGEPDISLDTLTWIHTHKTAALLRVSCACGAILGGADAEDVKRVSEFAVKTGLAFQIADDVLDVTASTEELGKTAGKDQATDKATYPRLLGLDGSRRQAAKLIEEAKQCLAPYGERSNTLLALADFIINRSN